MSALLRSCSSASRVLFDLSTTSGGVTLRKSRVINGTNQNYFCKRFNQTSSSSVSSGSSMQPPVTVNQQKASPMSSSIAITEKCKERLRKILDEPGAFLRVAVDSGGCSGFQYKFEIDNKLSSDDIIVHKDVGEVGSNGIPAMVVVDAVSLDIIKGSTLEYETELIRSAFRIVNNPHAEQGCSCGASFNMIQI